MTKKRKQDDQQKQTDEKEKEKTQYKELEVFKKLKYIKLNFTKNKRIDEKWFKLIDEAAIKMGHIMTIGSRLMQYYIVYCLKNNLTLPEKKDIRSIFMSMCYEKETNNNIHQDIIKKFLEKTKVNLFLPEPKGLAAIITHSIKNFETHFIRYHTEAIQAHYKWFIKEKYQITKKQAKWFTETFWPQTKSQEEIKELKEQEKYLSQIQLERRKEIKEKLKEEIDILKNIQLNHLHDFIHFHYQILLKMNEIPSNKKNMDHDTYHK